MQGESTEEAALRDLRVNQGDDYNIERLADQYLARAARENGMSNGHYLQDAGISSPALAARIQRHEIYSSALPELVLTSIVERTDWRDDHPGGPVIPSIIDNGKVSFKKDMKKRRRGRPVKHFVRGPGQEE